MVSFGYSLSSEEHSPADLVRYAGRAEDNGFDFVSISDHYHPWVSEQGHSPFVWSVLGAVAATTSRIEAVVGVTCPIVRIHPAIIAHASATTALLFDGRFSLGLGTGEALNEHILGDRWPRPEIRLEMLAEAIDVIRALWDGDTVDHRGTYYEVDNARLFDPPDPKPPIVISGFGAKAIELAGLIGDGYYGTAPTAEMVDGYRAAGGTGPTYGQLALCWAGDAAEARRTVRRVWPNKAIAGQLSQDLPTWTHFEQATEKITEEQATESTPCGPDVHEFVDAAAEYIRAGYDHLSFHQIGPDQDGFFDFWSGELQPALQEQLAASPAAAGARR